MIRKQVWKSSCASLELAAMLFSKAAVAAKPALSLATSTGTLNERYANLPSNETRLTEVRKLALIRRHIK